MPPPAFNGASGRIPHLGGNVTVGAGPSFLIPATSALFDGISFFIDDKFPAHRDHLANSSRMAAMAHIWSLHAWIGGSISFRHRRDDILNGSPVVEASIGKVDEPSRFRVLSGNIAIYFFCGVTPRIMYRTFSSSNPGADGTLAWGITHPVSGRARVFCLRRPLSPIDTAGGQLHNRMELARPEVGA